MSKTEGPQSEIGGCVRDTPQTVLDGVNGLVYENLAHVKLKKST